MAKIKGCINKDCVVYAKRTKFKEDSFYCSKCGSKLEYVCPSCYGVLDDRNKKICDSCAQKKNDAKEKRKNNVMKAAGVALNNADKIKVVAKKENLDKAVAVGKRVVKYIRKI